jgi:prepilin signal peptidase PulO-like enzyme (type II secretory pathway)
LFLKGKCRSCEQPIPRTYFWVELATALLFVLTAYLTINKTIQSAEVFRNLFFVSLLIVIFVYDYKYQLVLSSVAWLGALVGLFINIKYLGLDPYDLFFGAAIGGGFFLAQYLISKGRWIGGGDVRIGVMMGCWLGFKGVLVALFIAYVTGALFGLILLSLRKKEMSSAIPFGTFLSVATFLTIFWGRELMIWYLGLFHLIRI